DAGSAHTDCFVIGAPGASSRGYHDALRLVGVLRRSGLAVDHTMSVERYTTQAHRTQLDAARRSGAASALYFDGDGITCVAISTPAPDPLRLSAAEVFRTPEEHAGRLRSWLQQVSRLSTDI